jgi:hypothetical protein
MRCRRRVNSAHLKKGELSNNTPGPGNFFEASASEWPPGTRGAGIIPAQEFNSGRDGRRNETFALPFCMLGFPPGYLCVKPAIEAPE